MPESNNIQPSPESPSGIISLKPANVVQYRRDLRPRGFRWANAAKAFSEGKQAQEVASLLEVPIGAIYRWKRNPKFKALLARYQSLIDAEAVSTGVALQQVRMRKLNRHAARIEKRLDPPEIEGQPSQPLDIAEFAVLDHAYRATIEQAAKEMGGQYAEQTTNDRGSGVSVTFNFPVATQEQLDAVNNAPVIDLPPMARRLLTRPSDGKQR